MFGTPSMGGRLKPNLLQIAVDVVHVDHLIFIKDGNAAEEAIRDKFFNGKPIQQRK